MINPHLPSDTLKDNEYPIFECAYAESVIPNCLYYHYSGWCVRCEEGYYPTVFSDTTISVCSSTNNDASYDS